ncbi:hypothetical protein DIPPA_11108 [Diplonema papillatum]|nr:hypothetical protein DIPPA_11108 [Diplonema papillatum]
MSSGGDRASSTRENRCTHCRQQVAFLHKLEGTGLISMTTCPSCHRVADSHSAFTPTLVLVDVLLMREAAIYSLLYNRFKLAVFPTTVQRLVVIVALTLLSVAADAMEEERVMSPARLAQSAAGLASFFATAVPLVHATSGAPLFETAVLMASSTWFLLLLGACLVWDYEPAAAGFVVNVFGVPFAARHVLFPRLLVLWSASKHAGFLGSPYRLATPVVAAVSWAAASTLCGTWFAT